MSEDIKGVFVRLPLSEDMVDKAGEAYCKNIADASDHECLTNELLAIGTPVTGGDLYPVGYISEDAIGGLDTGIYSSASIFREKDVEHYDTVSLVRQSDALAQIAARDAEVMRLRDALTKISSVIEDRKYTETYSALKFCESVAALALKGGAV